MRVRDQGAVGNAIYHRQEGSLDLRGAIAYPDGNCQDKGRLHLTTFAVIGRHCDGKGRPISIIWRAVEGARVRSKSQPCRLPAARVGQDIAVGIAKSVCGEGVSKRVTHGCGLVGKPHSHHGRGIFDLHRYFLCGTQATWIAYRHRHCRTARTLRCDLHHSIRYSHSHNVFITRYCLIGQRIIVRIGKVARHIHSYGITTLSQGLRRNRPHRFRRTVHHLTKQDERTAQSSIETFISHWWGRRITRQTHYDRLCPTLRHSNSRTFSATR